MSAIGMQDENPLPGTVQAIWRYPVKSMGGEKLAVADITARGVHGDRALALVEPATNRAAVVRSWAARLFDYHASYPSEQALETALPVVRITTPDGAVLSSDQADIDQVFSAAFQRDLRLLSSAPPGLLVAFPPGTLAGKLAELTEAPLAGSAPPGTFFDAACIHLIASATLAHLQTAFPETSFDVRRFRPNIVVETHGAPYVENDWVGRLLGIGDQVVLRVTRPCPRCVNASLAQGDLPRAPGILRAIAQHNLRDLGAAGELPCVGVYADVVQTGRIVPGDRLRLLD